MSHDSHIKFFATKKCIASGALFRFCGEMFYSRDIKAFKQQFDFNVSRCFTLTFQ